MRMILYMGAPQPFNASNNKRELYIQRFEHFLLANRIDGNNEKCHLLLVLMGAPTFKLLASLLVPKYPGELKFNEIYDTVKKYYLPQPIKIAERYCFYNRNQLQGESATDYLAKLRKVGKNM